MFLATIINTGVCRINTRHERKGQPQTSPNTSLELEQGCRRAASHHEIGSVFRTPLHSDSDQVEDGTQEAKSRRKEGDA